MSRIEIPTFHKEECKDCKHWGYEFLGFLSGRCLRSVINLPIERWCKYEQKRV